MDFRAELSRLRLGVVTTALELVRELEAGRAQTPFQDQLAAFALAEPNVPVRAAIVAASPDLARALLADVLGSDYNVCKVVVPSRLGYSEVLLQERGFLLDAGGGAREFDDPGAFVEALQATHALDSRQASDLEPLRLKLKGPAHLSGLCLLIPQNLDALVSKPALLSTLADQADWLFLAGDPTTRLDDGQRQAIQLILDQVTGIQNVMVTDAPDSPGGEEWWKGWRATLSLGLVRQGSDLLRTRLALLTAPESELRQYLVEARVQRQLETVLSLLEEEVRQAQRMLNNRLQLTREGLVGGAPDLRKGIEGIRSRLADECDRILKAQEREAKAALAPEGDVARRIRDVATAIGADDLAQTPGETTIKLTLSPAASDRLVALVDEVARQQREASCRAIQEGVECSVRDAENALEKATGVRHKLNVSLVDEPAFRDQLQHQARPELRYRGEMPRPTLASRFNAARQSIMSLMILGTLLSGAAAFSGEDSGSLRTILYGLMLPLLVLGFLWTYISFRKKEQLTLEKEVEKLQDGVVLEVRRALQEVLREQQSALNEAVQRVQRTLSQQIDAALERLQQMRQTEAEEQRRRQTEQQRGIEQRNSRLRQIGQHLAALRPRLTQMQKLQQQWLGAWINRFNQNRV